LKNIDAKLALRPDSVQLSVSKSSKENVYAANGASGIPRAGGKPPQGPLQLQGTTSSNVIQLRTKNSVFKNCTMALSAQDLNRVGQKIRRIEVQQGDTENLRKYELPLSDFQPSSATRRSGVAVKKV